MNEELFDPRHGVVDRAVHADPELFGRELTSIFRRCWLFVGHESQIPEPFDFVASRMGRDHVIVSRSGEGEVSVLLNSCRHKGMRVSRYDCGRSRSFTCPYHAWTYSIDGELVDSPGMLVGVQRYREAYDGTLDKREWSLVRARVQSYKGAIFATWDHDAPPLEEYLGEFRPFFDVLLDAQDGSDAGVELVGGVYRWRVRANWKVCSENFIGDPLHVVSHVSVEAVGIGPSGVAGTSRHGVSNYGDFLKTQHNDFSAPRWGHGGSGRVPYEVKVPRDADIFPHFVKPVGPADSVEVTDAYYRDVARRRWENRKGKMDVASPFMVGGVFPNMSFHSVFPRTIAVWHPISPTESEGWRWAVVDRDAPKEVKALVRHHLMRYAGPVGMTEEDDMENWWSLTEAAQGDAVRPYPFNYQARLGKEEPVEGLPGLTSTRSSATEGNQRGFYRAWQRHLHAGTWPEYLAATEAELGDWPAPAAEGNGRD